MQKNRIFVENTSYTLKKQEIKNKIKSDDKRTSIKTATTDMENQLIITKATKDNLKDADSVLGNFNAVTNEITIRIYDCDDNQLNEISKNFEVEKIRKF